MIFKCGNYISAIKKFFFFKYERDLQTCLMHPWVLSNSSILSLNGFEHKCPKMVVS